MANACWWARSPIAAPTPARHSCHRPRKSSRRRRCSAGDAGLAFVDGTLLARAAAPAGPLGAHDELVAAIADVLTQHGRGGRRSAIHSIATGEQASRPTWLQA